MNNEPVFNVSPSLFQKLVEWQEEMEKEDTTETHPPAAGETEKEDTTTET